MNFSGVFTIEIFLFELFCIGINCLWPEHKSKVLDEVVAGGATETLKYPTSIEGKLITCKLYTWGQDIEYSI